MEMSPSAGNSVGGLLVAHRASKEAQEEVPREARGRGDGGLHHPRVRGAAAQTLHGETNQGCV